MLPGNRIQRTRLVLCAALSLTFGMLAWVLATLRPWPAHAANTSSPSGSLELGSRKMRSLDALKGNGKIAFGSTRDSGNHEIYVMNADGSNQTRITNNSAYDDQPRWSPDGTKIAFMTNRNANFEIYSMNADGNGLTRLTNNPAADGFPAWSPDGSKIAFVSGDLRNPMTFEIYVMNS